MDWLRKLLFRLYWKAEAIIVPGLTSSQSSYYQTLRSIVPGAVWLDLGCGHQVFSDWMTKEQDEVVRSCKSLYGIDLDWVGLKAHPAISNKVFGDLTHLPFQADSMTVVTANMVAEHLEEPETVLREVHRVLAPGGVFVFHTPNYQGWPTRVGSSIPEGAKKILIRWLDGRREEDVFLTHYRMNTADEISRLAAQTGFAVENINMVSTSAATSMLGPVAWAELLYIRSLRQPKRAKRRSNIIATLRKKGLAPARA